MSEYYRQQIEDGQEFQDFVAWRLAIRGIVVNNFQSRSMQLRRGENMFGLEIKFDKKLQTTRNLWIECAEKTSADQHVWVPSGIHREDNSWLYGIGDYQQFFVFGKKSLRRFESQRKPVIRENDRKTSQGFLIPESMAQVMAELVVAWGDSQPHVVNSALSPQAPAIPMPALERDRVHVPEVVPEITDELIDWSFSK